MTPSSKNSKAPKNKERTCASCRKVGEPSGLIRWVRAEDGQVFPDLSNRSFGRGAWIHPHLTCLKQLPKALQRSFRAPIATTGPEAMARLGQAAEHRVSQLLGAARRQNLLVFGSDATRDAWLKGDVELLLVARDARAAASATYVEEAIRAGGAKAWGTKQVFGALFGRPAIGVLGVRDRGLARGLIGAIAMALLVQERSLDGSAAGSGA